MTIRPLPVFVAAACWTMIIAPAKEGNAMAFVIKSAAFEEGKEIPRKYTGEGEDVSPQLEWSGLPKGTQEIALICDDPDAPTSEPWVHWVIYKIPATVTRLPEGISRKDRPDSPAGAIQGNNTWDRIGYNGPLPPPGHGWHRYFFKLYALDTAVALKAGATKDELLTAMKGHILGQAQLVGKYKR